MNRADVPEIVVRRLPLYARALQWLEMDGVQTISSAELGANLGMTPAQIRKDLSVLRRVRQAGHGLRRQIPL